MKKENLVFCGRCEREAAVFYWEDGSQSMLVCGACFDAEMVRYLREKGKTDREISAQLRGYVVPLSKNSN